MTAAERLLGGLAYIPFVHLALLRRRDGNPTIRYHARTATLAWGAIVAVLLVYSALTATPLAPLITETVVGAVFVPLILIPLGLAALALIAPGYRIPAIVRLTDRSAATASTWPPATLRDRLLCASCYIPLVPINYLARTSTRRNPTLQFHAWQGVQFLLGFILLLVVVFIPWNILAPGQALTDVGNATLLIVVCFHLGLGILALIHPAIRIPGPRWFPEWILRPAEAGEVPSTIANHGLARIGAALAMGVGLVAIVFSSGSPNPVLSILLGGLFLAFGHRLGAVGARHVLARTTSAPVVYLRSFAIDNADEGTDARATSEELVGMRDEHILAELFGEVGPVVAIGRPGERLPQLGAARIYFRNEDWQQGIREMLDRSQLAILRVGSSEGFLWEVRNVVANVPAEKVLLYFSHRLSDPDLQREYGAFVARTREIFPRPLPPTIGRERFVAFERDWTPRLIGAVEPTTASLLRFVPPPFGTYLLEAQVRTRLSRALADWFRTRGLATTDAPLFSESAIVLASVAGGPIGAGTTLAWNAWRTAGIARALAILGLGIGTATLVAMNRAAIAAFLVAGGATMPQLATTEFFATLTLIGAASVMPAAARRLLRIGGRALNLASSGAAIAVCGALWLACWR